jgi:hypothetical protein
MLAIATQGKSPHGPFMKQSMAAVFQIPHPETSIRSGQQIAVGCETYVPVQLSFAGAEDTHPTGV